ncbi:hypothetical protein D3C74_395390 [compost metagenome]
MPIQLCFDLLPKRLQKFALALQLLRFRLSASEPALRFKARRLAFQIATRKLPQLRCHQLCGLQQAADTSQPLLFPRLPRLLPRRINDLLSTQLFLHRRYVRFAASFFF